MSAPPLPMTFDGVDCFRVLPNFARQAREHYGAGEVVAMAAREDRSAVAHRHFMASVNQAWKTLPDGLAQNFPSADHLRKFALIQTGHYDAAVYPCQFKTEAKRLRAALSANDDFAVIVVDGKTVTKLTAKSQSYYAMNRREFQQAKADVLAYLDDLLGVPAGTVARQREAA